MLCKLPIEDGDCTLYSSFLDVSNGNLLFEQLMHQVEWQQQSLTLFGRKVPSPRLTAWYGDAGASYRYSGITNHPLPWVPTLLQLKHRLEQHCDTRFNSVLLNLYRDGNDAMGWHADDEKELGEEPVIGSVSLGGSRRFLMRHKYKKRNYSPPTRTASPLKAI